MSGRYLEDFADRAFARAGQVRQKERIKTFLAEYTFL
jgi:hypothetical protein